MPQNPERERSGLATDSSTLAGLTDKHFMFPVTLPVAPAACAHPWGCGSEACVMRVPTIVWTPVLGTVGPADGDHTDISKDTALL